MEKIYKIAYIVADLKRVGPSNQTLNIINNSPIKENCVVITLFEEPNDTMINEYINNNIKVISMNLNRKTFLFCGIRKVREKLIDLGVTVIHSNGIKADVMCQKVIKNTNIKHIITLRNYPKEDILTRMNFFKGRIALYNHLKVLKKAKFLVACSKTIEQKMKNDYPKMNIIAIQNGVDVEKFIKISKEEKNKLRKKYDIDVNKKIFISTSSFIPRKRIEETIQAFLKSDIDDKLLILLGDGNEFESIYNKYNEYENIKFIGKTDKVTEYLNMSDVFVSSSESEGLPNGVIEAIASGIPVILSNISQHIEILDEVSSSGLMYKLGEISEFSEKMKESLLYDNSKCDISSSNLNMKKMSMNYYEYYLNNMFNEKIKD